MASTKQIEDALGSRIRQDNPGQFDQATWKEKPFSRYYGNDDEMVNIVVYETTERVVNGEGKTLPVVVWQQLIEEVGPTTTPKSAIPKMRLASFAAVMMVGADEGLDAGRPAEPPVLRRRRPSK